MAEIITEDQPRIKFRRQRVGDFSLPAPLPPELQRLSELMAHLEALGAAPVLNDGLVGGNCAVRAAALVPRWLPASSPPSATPVSRTEEGATAGNADAGSAATDAATSLAAAAPAAAAPAAAAPETAAAVQAGTGSAPVTEEVGRGWKTMHTVLVSRSGKAAGRALGPDDFVAVADFCPGSWTARFASCSDDVSPSSDTPLLHAALSPDAAAKYGWATQGHADQGLGSTQGDAQGGQGDESGELPAVAVHGHALADGEGLAYAQSLGLPISDQETLFSTPEDLDQLESLFRRYPYPAYCCYIRKGHGFFLLGADVADVRAKFERLVAPFLLTAAAAAAGAVAAAPSALTAAATAAAAVAVNPPR